MAQDPTVLWQFSTGGIVYSSAAVDDDGTVYFGSEDNRLYAVNPDGSPKWEFLATDWIDSSPAIGDNGTLYVGSWDGNLYAVSTENGSNVWEFSADGIIVSSPAIGADGTIYFGSSGGFLYALNPDGSLKWEFLAADEMSSSPAVAADGTVYVGTFAGILYALSPEGVTVWSFEVDTVADLDGRILSSPAIDENGAIYFGSGNNRLYSLDSEGTLKWTYEALDKVDSSPVIATDGTVFFGSRDGFLYALDSEGTPLWIQNVGDVFYSSPILDDEDNVYIAAFTGSNTSTLFAFSVDGTSLWSHLFSTQNAANLIDSSPTIAPNSVLYVGSYDNNLYAIDIGRQPGTSAWPKFSRDLRNTAAVDPANEAPSVLTNLGITMEEGGVGVIDSSVLRATDVESIDSSLVYNLVTLPEFGVLRKGDVALTVDDTFTQDEVDRGQLTFLHNNSETTADRFEFIVSDGADATGATTFDVTIIPINDLPVVAINLGITVDEGGHRLIDGSVLQSTDVDNTDGELEYQIVTLPDSGVLKKGSSVLAANDTLTQSDIDSGLLSFVHDGRENLTDQFDFMVSDSLDTTLSTLFSITISPLNDQPTATNDQFTVEETAAITIANLFDDNGFGIDSDPEESALTVSAINGSSGSVGTTTTLNSGALLTVQVGGLISYDPNGEINALAALGKTVTEEFTYTIDDGNGGFDTATVTIVVTGQVNVLEDLIDDIIGFMPGEDSDGYIAPEQSEVEGWRVAVQQILSGGDCDTISLPDSLAGIYTLSEFRDSANGNNYCVLMETGDMNMDDVADKGWGTFIVYRSPLRELHLQVPHPLDGGTGRQGIGVFKTTQARSFLMAGTHPDANVSASSCQGGFSESDVLYNVGTIFHETVNELNLFYATEDNFAVLQFHEISSDVCPEVDVYLTYGMGVAPAAADTLTLLQANFFTIDAGAKVVVPGDIAACSENGDKIVQGRLLNDVASSDLCTVPAQTYTGRFIYITQDSSRVETVTWSDAVIATWPSLQPMHTYTLELQKGWNLISVPVDTDTPVDQLFAGVSSGEVWRFRAGEYEAVPTLEPKVGYWVYCRSAADVNISGIEVFDLNINFSPVWNLLGAVAAPPFPETDQAIPFDAVLTSVDSELGIVWEFDGFGFKSSGNLLLGKGYWVYGN